MTVKSTVINTTTVFIAVFLVAATLSTQPMMLPRSAFAQPTPSPPPRGPLCPSGTHFNPATGFCGPEVAQQCPKGEPPTNGVCRVGIPLPDFGCSPPSYEQDGFCVQSPECPQGTILDPTTQKCGIIPTNCPAAFTRTQTGACMRTR